MRATETPFSGPPATEVPLEDAPLVRVIAQVRFPLIASVENSDFIAPFQEEIRQAYPALRPEQSRSFAVSPEGVMSVRSSNVWRFHDTTGVWRVSLASDALALETKQYSSRSDFMDRFDALLKALHKHLDPQVIDRLGVRYIDRVVGDDLRDLSQLVRPQVSGIMATPLADCVDQSISENIFTLPEGEGKLMARWGLVPPQGTVDPATIEPIDEKSWLLDLDAFTTEMATFDVATAVSQVQNFAGRIYSFFRWAVTDEFLERYGGKS